MLQKELLNIYVNPSWETDYRSIRLGLSSTTHPLVAEGGFKGGEAWAKGEMGRWNWDLDGLDGGESDLLAWEELALLDRAFVRGGGTIDRSTALVLLALLASGVGVGAVWIDIAAVDVTRTWLWKLGSRWPTCSFSIFSWKFRTVPMFRGYNSKGS